MKLWRVLPVILFAAAVAQSSDWPQWLGPDGDRIYKGGDFNPTFPAKGPEVLWRSELGTGFASFAVADGVVCGVGYRKGSDTIVCLDALTGEKKWDYTYNSALVDNLHEGGPSGTPAIHDGRIYTISKDGQFFCLSQSNGKVLWKKNIPEEFGAKMPEWGFSGSPIIDGNTLYLDAGATIAMDRVTGAVKWKTKAFKAGYSTPCLFEQNGQRLMAVLNVEGLMVLDRKDGKVLARTPWKTQYDVNVATPIYHNGKIFVSSAYNKGCGLFEFDGRRLKPVYQNRNMRNHMDTSVLWKGHLFGIDRLERHGRLVKLVCMDFETGKIVWSEGGFGCGMVFIADDHLVVMTDRGELVTAPASTSGFKQVSRGQVLPQGRCWTVPVLANGLLYARNAKGNMVCADLRR